MRKGQKITEETRKKMSLGKIGKRHSEEHKKKIGDGNRGKIVSIETRKKLSIALKGHKSWNKGIAMYEKSKDKIRGKNNYNWQGGISKLPYSFNFTKELKKSIKERDNYTCQLCGEKEEKLKHCVHHIDYNKQNNDPKNLITLCVKCHIKTNFNRDSWELFFTKGIIITKKLCA